MTTSEWLLSGTPGTYLAVICFLAPLLAITVFNNVVILRPLLQQATAQCQRWHVMSVEWEEKYNCLQKKRDSEEGIHQLQEELMEEVKKSIEMGRQIQQQLTKPDSLQGVQ